jgi:hypothetical protein
MISLCMWLAYVACVYAHLATSVYMVRCVWLACACMLVEWLACVFVYVVCVCVRGKCVRADFFFYTI